MSQHLLTLLPPRRPWGDIASFLKAHSCSHTVRKTQTVNEHVEQVISLLCCMSGSVHWWCGGGPRIPPLHAREGLWRRLEPAEPWPQ